MPTLSQKLALPLVLLMSSLAFCLTYSRREGLNMNSFVQDGSVAAHLVLKDGKSPRILVAFPAGNSGTGLWFEDVSTPVHWKLLGDPAPHVEKDSEGRPLYGIRFRANVQAPQLVIKQAVLSNVRVLRDYRGGAGHVPPEVLTKAEVTGNTIRWSRNRLDGAAGYQLVIRVVDGRVNGDMIRAGTDGKISLVVTAVTGDKPLTPFGPGTLLEPTAAANPAARQALRFLSYREKFLAGSWRFNTYFGRDTLISVRLLMPVLKPDAIEAALNSVLDRLSPDGNVAHEEDISEFAILEHKVKDGSLSAAPIYDYKMMDSAYLLTPVLKAWLIDDPRGRARAAAFLARNGAGAKLMRNVRYVLSGATPFAQDANFDNLIALKPGVPVGEWRDSNDGLGGGRYPYDINAVLVPASLEAVDALYREGLLDPYVGPEDRELLSHVTKMTQVWNSRAGSFFIQEIPSSVTKEAITQYASIVGIAPEPALAAIGSQAIRFDALSLDGNGKPIPVENSDGNFGLLFGNPSSDQLILIAQTIRRPFPAGLMTGAGMVVANPAFANASLQKRFDKNAYHGTVVWSWQQALAAAGLARQLARKDLSTQACESLRSAQADLWKGIEAGREFSASELWSWRYANGRYEIVPFGSQDKDSDESNAAQLWSTVYLAVQRPAKQPQCEGSNRKVDLSLLKR